VLQRQCGDPEIVVGNRGAGALELNEQPGVALSRFPIREQNPNRGLGEQFSQQDLIAMPLGAPRNPALISARTTSGIQTSSQRPSRSARAASP
jgi:hypothetical protein